MKFRVGDFVTFNRTNPHSPALSSQRYKGTFFVTAVEHVPAHHVHRGAGHAQWVTVKDPQGLLPGGKQFSGLYFETDEYIEKHWKDTGHVD